jgi:molybdopterin-guanine dinucleotide biosynthesis protein MobB
MTLPHILISGPSNSGKTTLIEQLLPRLRAFGLRVATVKHAHHGLELDPPGQDSWRHAQAGASAVALVSPERTMWILRTSQELSMHAAIGHMEGWADLVLIEGFKGAPGTRILIEPGARHRLTVHDDGCHLGVPSWELTEAEWTQLTAFCRAVARQALASTP